MYRFYMISIIKATVSDARLIYKLSKELLNELEYHGDFLDEKSINQALEK